MGITVYTKSFDTPPVDKREILRYAGAREGADDIESLMEGCLAEASEVFTFKVCYSVVNVTRDGDRVDLEFATVTSQGLSKVLDGCERAVVFAATVGIGLDRLIAKYGRLSPSKALMLQAIGAERIEALCDAFCAELAAELHCKFRPRFSPGYGDFPITAQKELFAVLDCTRQIGVTLNDSLLMSPTKSVTAIVGITDE